MKRKLILIDGMAVLYRSFFAIHGLSTKDGQATNALFGLIRTLNHIRATHQPTHWSVLFEGGLPEDRTTLVKEYKATRPPMPEDLESQIALSEQYLTLADIAWERCEGEEADDLMAAIVKQAKNDAAEILLVTSDKDMYQLVDDTVLVLPPGVDKRPLGPLEVEDKTGVPPDRIVDWLALIGDASDNISGVPGVGPKTAARLLKKYSSVDNLWRHLSDVEGEKLRNTLERYKDVVIRNVEMVTLRSAIPYVLDWEKMKTRSPDPARLLPFLKALEFHALVRQLEQANLFSQ